MSAVLLVALAGWGSALLAALTAAGLRADGRRRAELVARACHEVRGPLTAARLAAHLVRRRAEDDDGPLRAIDEELVQADRLLEDLTAAARGRRPPGSLGEVDVAALLGRVCDAWRPAAVLRGRDVAVVAPGRDLLVRGDARGLQQALSNLVANALEHGAGTVLLAARASCGRLRLEVADGGAGLPAPAAALAAAAPRGGAHDRGRGLAIAADVAARHGGHLADAPAGVVLDLPLGATGDGRGLADGGTRATHDRRAWTP